MKKKTPQSGATKNESQRTSLTCLYLSNFLFAFVSYALVFSNTILWSFAFIQICNCLPKTIQINIECIQSSNLLQSCNVAFLTMHVSKFLNKWCPVYELSIFCNILADKTLLCILLCRYIFAM